MNTPAVRRVADAIESDPSRYAQAAYGSERAPVTECTTAACVAGWTVSVEDPGFYKVPQLKRYAYIADYGPRWATELKVAASGVNTASHAVQLLDIREADRWQLFPISWPESWFRKLRDARPESPPMNSSVFRRCNRPDGRSRIQENPHGGGSHPHPALGGRPVRRGRHGRRRGRCARDDHR